jgi:hypothetical protein
MTEYFGKVSFTDTSSKEFGIPSREIKSFKDAALEASISRLYGGIHYRFDLEEGNKLGQTIGEIVVAKIKMKKGEKAINLSKN